MPNRMSSALDGSAVPHAEGSAAVDRPADGSGDRPADGSAGRSGDRPADGSAGRSGDRPADGSAGRSGDRPADGLATATRPGYADLSPVSFLLRSARVFPARVAVQDAQAILTYADLLTAAQGLAGELAARGVGRGDRVAVVLPNTTAMLAAHFAVPGMGAVLVPVNTRLTALELGYVLEHSGARCVIVDKAFQETVAGAVAEMAAAPTLLEISDSAQLESIVTQVSPRALEVPAEMDLLSVNYTSGTTGRPKGVMYTHRGAYLHTLGVIAECGISSRTSLLWTLPMFHCNGWAFTWAVTAMGGRHICLRRVDAAEVWRHLREDGVTHFCGAPTVLETLLTAGDATAVEQTVRVYTGGAPPSPATIERCEELNWDITHLYGLTETYGPIGICEWHPEWDERADAERFRLKARQGVEGVASRALRVVDESGRDVPADGATLGEIVAVGNNVTVGYLGDADETARAFAGGVFHTGDAAVVHPDGYLEIRDRIKDVVISGGENVSTIEVEQAIAAHPEVSQAAVIGMPHEKWGETPWAFVVLREPASLTAEQLRAFLRERLAGYKLPSRTVFIEELPTTSTGKVQKFALRDLARTGESATAG